MVSITKFVISNEITNSPNCGVEGSHSPNEQDPRYNEHGFRGKIFSKNHRWFSLRQRPAEFTPDLPIKNCPNLTVCTLLPTKLHQTWKNMWSFSSSFLFFYNRKKCCFLFLFIYSKNHWASKSIKQIDDAFFHLCDSAKGANASLKATASSSLHFKGQVYHKWGRSPTIQQDDTYRHIQASSSFTLSHA